MAATYRAIHRFSCLHVPLIEALGAAAIEKGAPVHVITPVARHKDGTKLLLQTDSHVRQGHSEGMSELMR